MGKNKKRRIPQKIRKYRKGVKMTNREDKIQQKIEELKKSGGGFENLDLDKQTSIAAQMVEADEKAAQPMTIGQWESEKRMLTQRVEALQRKAENSDMTVDTIVEIMKERLEISTAELSERAMVVSIRTRETQLNSFQEALQNIPEEQRENSPINQQIQKLETHIQSLKDLLTQLISANQVPKEILDSGKKTLARYAHRHYQLGETLYDNDHHFGLGQIKIIKIDRQQKGLQAIEEDEVKELGYESLEALKEELSFGLEVEPNTDQFIILTLE